MNLPYRRNAGAVLFNRQGLVFLGRRADITDREVWGLPQGGIDAGEDPAAAIMRELHEEIGTDAAVILGVHPETLRYDLPEELIGVAFGGRYRGQIQHWFALLFTGEDSAINLEAHGDPEFSAWRWAGLGELAILDSGFKRAIYQRLAVDFLPFETKAKGSLLF